MNKAKSTETAFWKLVTAVQRLVVWTGLENQRLESKQYWCDVMHPVVSVVSSDPSV